MNTFKYITGHSLDCPLAKTGFYDSYPEYKGHEVKEFGVGIDNPKGLKLKPTIKDNKVIISHKIDTDFVGPPGFVHGGILATILDDVMGSVVIAAKPESFSMTARLITHYRKPVPLETAIMIEGWVCKREGKKMFAESAIYTEDKKDILVEAEGLFLEVL